MNSTPGPKETEPRDALVAGADERLAHAREEIKRADEQLTRLTEQVARMERDAAHPPPAGAGPQSPPAQSPPEQSSPRKLAALRGPMGLLLLAAFIVVAALILLSSYDGRTKLVVAHWAPQPASSPSLPPENPPLAAQPAASAVPVAKAEAAPPRATSVAQAAAPQDATATAAAASPDQTQLLQTIVRDLANVERNIEQLKANQQQMASDNAKAIGELKASQEEIRRVLAKVSEQNLSRTPPPQAQPAPAVRRPERPPQARARPRYPPEWMYDDW